MDYIQLIKDGHKVICNYKETQTDSYMNSWTQETWYKSNTENQYICTYSGLDFISKFYEEDFETIFNDILKMIKDEVEIIVEDLPNINSIPTAINSNWTDEQIAKMYECLLATYPLIKRFVDKTHDLNILKVRNKELISDARFWLAGFQSFKHD
jgi:hypothetical protein